MAKLKKPIFYRRGKYVVDYRDYRGIRHRPSFDTMKEANDEWAKAEARDKGHAAYAAEQVTLAEPMEIKTSIQQYRKIVGEHRAKETIRIERYYFEEIWEYLLNEHKIRFVHEITQFHLESFRQVLSSKGKMASSSNRQFNCYRAWLNKCVSWGLIAKNPMGTLERLREIPPDIKTWSDENIDDANKVVPLWLKDVLFFLERTGRRPIDAARATFGDIDETLKTIKVKSFKGGRIRIDYVQLTNDLFEKLMDLKSIAKREFRAKDLDVIFLNSKKKPITTNTIGLVLRRKGIKGKTSYGLRHTFINGLVDDGVHPRDVQLLAGHAKFETTTRYTHRDTKHLKEHVEKRAQRRSVQKIV